MIAMVGGACDGADRDPKWQPAGATTPRDGGTFRWALPHAISSLDPSICYEEYCFYALQALFDTLLGYAPGSIELTPRLAERWERSTDARTYRFWLHPGLTYSDGRPIVASDFKFSLERALTTADSPFGSLLSNVAGASDVLAGTTKDCIGITAPSPLELVIQLREPDVAFPYLVAMPFTTPQRADHVAAAGDALRARPLASGPFVLDSWAEGSEMILARNPRYQLPTRAHLERVVILENRSPATQFLMFEAGELDVALLAPPDYLWLLSRAAWAPYLQRERSLFALGTRINVRKKPFDDRRVRQALNFAVNKQRLIKLRQGRGIAAHGIVPPGLSGFDDTLAPYPYDPARAKALLAEAGYPAGFEVDYYGVAGPDFEPLASSLEADLAAVGVRLRRTTVSFSAIGASNGKPDGPPLSWTAWQADYPDPSNFIDARFHSRMISEDWSNNDSFYANPELDALLDRARQEIDPAARAALYRRAERILYDDAPWIWEQYLVSTKVVQPYVRGFEFTATGMGSVSHAWLDVGPDGKPVPR